MSLSPFLNVMTAAPVFSHSLPADCPVDGRKATAPGDGDLVIERDGVVAGGEVAGEAGDLRDPGFNAAPVGARLARDDDFEAAIAGMPCSYRGPIDTADIRPKQATAEN
jgi:hypothetical protein